MEVKEVSIIEIKPYAKNPRKNDKAVKFVAASIKEFGFQQPIVVDSYHSFANVGGGAFSGKDPTKVDRSGAYKARDIAVDYLMKLNLSWCEVQISYAIGIREPLARFGHFNGA